MKPLTTMFAMTLLLMISHQCHAQNQLFGGWGNSIMQGITGDRTPQPQQSNSGLSGLFGGGNNNTANPGLGSASGLLGGLPNLIPGLGGNNNGNAAPTDLLSRMNQKSKDAIDRTTNWAQQKKQAMSSKMFSGALDMLKPKSLQGNQGNQGNGLLQGASNAFDWLKPQSNQPLNQPPIRSAENYGQQPSMRY